MKQIYKDLYEDDEGQYCFIMKDGRKKLVVEQQGYLLCYLIELINKMVPGRLDND